jgi:hypothetical protein
MLSETAKLQLRIKIGNAQEEVDKIRALRKRRQFGIYGTKQGLSRAETIARKRIREARKELECHISR